jgi:uncharacterized protein
MTSTLIGVALILIAVIGWGWWYFFVMSRPNPPLPTAQVTINNTTSTNPAASSGSSSDAMVNDAGATVTVPVADIAATSTPAPVYSTGTLAVDGATFTVELATSTIAQTRGLSYRTSLAANAGMLFIFSTGTTQNFWMYAMNFPLDMIWISGNMVVGFAQDAAPQPGVPVWSLTIYRSPNNTDKVLEVVAGTVAKYNIKVGDSVNINQGS